MYVDICAAEHTWKSDSNLQELVPFYHHMNPREPTQVIKLGGKNLHLLKHLERHWVTSLGKY